MLLSGLTNLMRELRLGPSREWTRPPRDKVRILQDAVARGLREREFTFDCIERDVRAWEEWKTSGWMGMKPPIATVDELGISVMLFFWPPGVVAQPHEHTSWTVSAVFYNRLQVMTYDWDRTVATRSLAPKNLFWAKAGEVGHTYGPCLHSPRNPTKSWTTSLHIFPGDDRPLLEDQVGLIEGLEREVDASEPGTAGPQNTRNLVRLCGSVLRTHAMAARRFSSPETLALFERLYHAGDLTTRTLVSKLSSQIAPRFPSHRLNRSKQDAERSGRS